MGVSAGRGGAAVHGAGKESKEEGREVTFLSQSFLSYFFIKSYAALYILLLFFYLFI